jgi:hypothetical protein
MTQLSFLFLFVPAVLTLMVLAALLHECQASESRARLN